MQKKNILNSPRLLELKKHRRKIFLGKIAFYVFVFLAISFGLTYASRISVLNIGSIEVSGNKVVDTETIKMVVKKEINGYYLWFFPKTNVLFYPKDKIKNALRENFARLQNVNLSIKEDKILKIDLTERIVKYTWCGNTVDSTVGLGEGDTTSQKEKCYFMDAEGYIFDEAPYFSGEVYFKFYGTTDSNSDEPSGSYFLKENFGKLVSFKKTLENIGLVPAKLYKKDNGDIEFFLSRKNSVSIGPKIIFKIDSDFQKIAENLEVALDTEPLLSDFKNKYSSLLYIDLRFGNKVYYKFK
ncbi:MAG: hypothetical protein WC735_01325 [Candidatus Paceibacterota bacterium]|jgi:hypothetical protein